jgi:hypothetical protein
MTSAMHRAPQWVAGWRVARPASLRLVLLVLLLTGATLWADTAHAQDTFLPLVQANPTTPPPFCRLGVNGTHGSGPNVANDNSLIPLRVGWYQRYRTELTPTRPNGADYAQTIALTQTGPNSYSYAPNAAAILQIVAQNPGSMWLIGNEPDRRDYQDDLEPHVYAAATTISTRCSRAPTPRRAFWPARSCRRPKCAALSRYGVGGLLPTAYGDRHARRWLEHPRFCLE